MSTRRPVPGEEHLTRRPGTSNWHIRFTIDGQRFRESSGTDDKARAAALAVRRVQEEYDRIKLGVAPQREMTVREAYDRFWIECSHQRLQDHHRSISVAALGPNTRMSALSDAMVSDLMAHVRARGSAERPVAGGTLNRYLSALSAVCARARASWGVSVGAWDLKHHRGPEAKHRERFLSVADAQRLINAAVPHLKPILLLALATGLRRENVLRLTWEQVDLQANKCHVVQKGGRRHSVSVTRAVSFALEIIEGERKGPVFRFGPPCDCTTCQGVKGRTGSPIASIRTAFATACKAAGLPEDVRFHDLRHSFASLLLAASGNLVVVKEALGHASIANTSRYAHLAPGRKEAVITAATEGLSL